MPRDLLLKPNHCRRCGNFGPDGWRGHSFILETCSRRGHVAGRSAYQRPTARPRFIAHFTRADASQLFLKAVVRKFCVRRIANMLRRHFYSVSEMYRYYAPETTKSSQST